MKKGKLFLLALTAIMIWNNTGSQNLKSLPQLYPAACNACIYKISGRVDPYIFSYCYKLLPPVMTNRVELCASRSGNSGNVCEYVQPDQKREGTTAYELWYTVLWADKSESGLGSNYDNLMENSSRQHLYNKDNTISVKKPGKGKSFKPKQPTAKRTSEYISDSRQLNPEDYKR